MEQVEGVDGALNFFLERHLLPGYGWIFPGAEEGAPANVGMLVRTAALRRSHLSLRALWSGFVASGSLAWPHLRHARLLSAPAAFPLQMDFRKARLPGDSVLFLGDAAGLVNPLSGQGIGSALESAQAAAGAIVSAVRTGKSGPLREYETSVTRGFSPQFLGARLVRGLSGPALGKRTGKRDHCRSGQTRRPGRTRRIRRILVDRRMINRRQTSHLYGWSRRPRIGLDRRWSGG